MKKAKISLDQFKAKVSPQNQEMNVSKIAGGILGDCHCVYATYGDSDGNSVTYSFCVCE